MAGRAQRGSRAVERSPRGGSSWSAAGRSAAASGSTSIRTGPTKPLLPPPLPTTVATYRMLIAGGLSPVEAATLTAFVWGIPAGARWKLRELDRLLFTREVHRAGGFENHDGGHAPPH